MQYAINLNALLPVRADASERSEMVTQLLFGESCEILEKGELFFKIKNQSDSYIGWVDKKMIHPISEGEFVKLKEKTKFKVLSPAADVFCMNDKTIYRLPMGSTLPFYDIDSSKFGIGDITFQIHPDFVTFVDSGNKDGIIPYAKAFLNTPYLWGGKSIMGIDCSGFVQVVFSLNGYTLPRDASQQVVTGSEILFEDAIAGDLFFFEKAGKITHVGIYLGSGHIIHASGKVRIDNVDAHGIYTNENTEYTHKFSTIRRIE